MRILLPLALGPLGLLTLAACQPPGWDDGPDVDAFTAHLPDERILAKLPDDADRAVGELANSYLMTRGVTWQVNAWIGAVLLTLDHVTDLDPSWSEEEARYAWGPWSDGGLDPNHTMLWVEQQGDSYVWAVVKRAKSAADEGEWTPVTAGEVTPDGEGGVASGSFVFDFDALRAMEPWVNATGTFGVVYSIDADGYVEVEAGLEDFAEDVGAADRADIGYAYGQTAGGDGWMDLAYVGQGGDDETGVLRTRWLANGEGRGDALIFGGDLEDGVFEASECWGTDFRVVYETHSLFGYEDGDESACAFDVPDWPET